MEDDIEFEGLDRRENRWNPDIEEKTHRINLLNFGELEKLGK